MKFDEYLQQASDSNHLTIDSGWAQGTTTFGGLSAALLLQHLQSKFELDNVLRSLSVNFCGALQTEKSRSEEHTSELQSRPHLVCRLLLEKKKKKNKKIKITTIKIRQ